MLERYIFVEKPLPINIARNKVLKQMITSTTSGWFRKFLILNFGILRLRDKDYINKKIKKIKG